MRYVAAKFMWRPANNLGSWGLLLIQRRVVRPATTVGASWSRRSPPGTPGWNVGGRHRGCEQGAWLPPIMCRKHRRPSGSGLWLLAQFGPISGGQRWRRTCTVLPPVAANASRLPAFDEVREAFAQSDNVLLTPACSSPPSVAPRPSRCGAFADERRVVAGEAGGRGRTRDAHPVPSGLAAPGFWRIPSRCARALRRIRRSAAHRWRRRRRTTLHNRDRGSIRPCRSV